MTGAVRSRDGVVPRRASLEAAADAVAQRWLRHPSVAVREFAAGLDPVDRLILGLGLFTPLRAAGIARIADVPVPRVATSLRRSLVRYRTIAGDLPA